MSVKRALPLLFTFAATILVTGLTLSLPATPATLATTAPAQGITAMTQHAKGSFDVKVTPQPAEDGIGDPSIGRLGLFKQLHGDLEGSARGQMLAIRTAVEGSASYVAMDFVDATLAGRKGTFALQHVGTMGHGKTRLDITVVPDSGTGELVGIDGTFAITIENGAHFYDFAYTLPATP